MIKTLSGETQLLSFRDGVKLRASIELAEDRPDVRAHSGVADVKALGYGPVVDPVDHERQDLFFSRRQARQQFGSPCALARDLAALCESARDRADGDERLACRGSPDGLDDRGAAHRLEQIAAGTSLNSL